MKKGIVSMGFPNLKDIKPAFKEEYEKVIASDANKLKDLVFNASESLFSRQLLQSKPPERQPRAWLDMKKQGDVCVLF